MKFFFRSLVIFAFTFFFVYSFVQKSFARFCSCTPGEACTVDSINDAANYPFGSNISNQGNVGEYKVTYSDCANDCNTCSATGSYTNTFAPGCFSGSGTNNTCNFSNPTCPNGFNCNWSTSSSCPAGFSVSGSSCSLTGAYGETYNGTCCVPAICQCSGQTSISYPQHECSIVNGACINSTSSQTTITNCQVINNTCEGIITVPRDQCVNGACGYLGSGGTFTNDVGCNIGSTCSNYQGGPTGCTTDQTYYECNTDPNFGACGYLVTKYGGPVEHLVTHNTCTGWDCHDNNTLTSCQSSIGGHVFIDNQDGPGVHDGVQNNGEVSANASQQTTIEISGNGTNYTVKTDVNGNYTFGPSGNDLIGGAYTVQVITPPTNYLVSTGQQSVTISTSNRNPTNINFGIYPNVYNVSGTIYIDKNENGNWDKPTEQAATNAVGSITITDGAGQTASMNADGTYTLTNVLSGNSYTLSIVPPAPNGYTANQTIPITVNGANVSSADIGIIPLYGISGAVFKNTYKDFVNTNGQSTEACYTPGYDQNYTDSPINVTITNSQGVIVKTITTTNGSFNTKDTNGFQTLPSGNYDVAFASALPNGYQIETPSSYPITIGPSCTTGNPMQYCDQLTTPSPPYPATKPSCDATGNVINISFGLDNENPFYQLFCEDYSNDQGIFDPLPPVGTTCNGVPSGYLSYTNTGCNLPGIVFYNGSYYFGQGQATPNVGSGPLLVNRPYTPLNPQVNQIAYSFVETTLKQRGVVPIDLSGTDPTTGQPYCTTSTGDAGLSNCQLENNLPSGIYQIGPIIADSNNPVKDLTITASPTFNADVNNPKTYIFLISGNLNIGNNDKTKSIKILVPNGASAAFIAQQGINIDPYVGEQNAQSLNPDLEGIYVSGTDFTINSLATQGAVCQLDGSNIDKRLNIVGYLVTGAEGNGSIINLRDLCSYDQTCPAQTISTGDTATGNGSTGLGNTYLLNVSNVLKLRTSFQQEVAPGP